MSDVEQRKQRSQNNRQNEHNSDKTKKNFTGFYTEMNPEFHPGMKLTPGLMQTQPEHAHTV